MQHNHINTKFHRTDTFLEEVNCSYSLFPGCELITISKNESLSQALKVLSEAQVLSMPVIDKDGKAVKMLSLFDVVDYILQHICEEDLQDDLLLEKRRVELIQSKISQLSCEIGSLDKPFNVMACDKLSTAVQTMIKHKAHRVLVLNSDGKPESLITQSRVVQLLSMMSSSNKLKTVGQLELVKKKVVSISKEKKALHAFQLMKSHKVSAVAVVDEDDRFVGDISVSDIKVLGQNMESVSSLNAPISAFLREIQKNGGMDNETSGTLCCSLSSTLDYALEQLSHRKIHRLFIVDSSRKPIGVLSMYDLLCHLCKLKPKPRENPNK